MSPRLRPSRATVAATIGLVGALGFGAVRELIWDELKGGMLNLRGLRRPLQALVVFGFALLLVMLVAMIFNDFLRGRYDLFALPSGTTGRGTLIPSPLLSVTLFVLAVGWAFVLASAIETPLVSRIALLVVVRLLRVGVARLRPRRAERPPRHRRAGWECSRSSRCS